MSTSQEAEKIHAFLLVWKGDLKGRGQREASVKVGAGWLEGPVLTVSEGVVGEPRSGHPGLGEGGAGLIPGARLGRSSHWSLFFSYSTLQNSSNL